MSLLIYVEQLRKWFGRQTCEVAVDDADDYDGNG